MDIIKELQQELRDEYEITKKFIKIYPEEKSDWKPHDKSGTFQWLTTHLVQVFSWPQAVLNSDYWDIAKTPYTQPEIQTRREMLEKLDNDFELGRNALENLKMEDFNGKWDMRHGDHIIFQFSKYSAVRQALNQITHHRAQLGVYYRLNDIPVPASYGPSADSME